MYKIIISAILVVTCGLVFCQMYFSYGEDADSNKTLDQKNASSQNIVLPPLEQLNSGIPSKNVTCPFGQVKVKIPDSPLGCVYLQTAQKLVKRGWPCFPSPSKEQPKMIMSTSTGTNPLKVGFFLDGSIISDRKYWIFGNNRTEGWNFELLENQEYSFPPRDKTAHTYHGSMNVTDYYGNCITTKTFDVTVSPNRATSFSGFDQNQGVIYQKDLNGFDFASPDYSTGSKICGSDYCINWTFGDESSIPMSTPPEHSINPFHHYNVTGKMNGKVSLTVVKGESTQIQDWNFTTLVLNNSKSNNTSQIQEGTYPYNPESSYKWPANKQLRFWLANPPTVDPVLNYMWNFTHNKNESEQFIYDGAHYPQIIRTYTQNGTYLMNVTITGTDRNGKTNYHTSILETLYICPNPDGLFDFCKLS